MKKRTKQRNWLPLLAGVVLISAAAVMLVPKIFHGNETPEDSVLASGADLVIQSNEINSTASYFDYDADGTVVQVIAVRASDDTVRLALNTCQVCNGSPYAYFEQDGDDFICQNCKNRFASAEIGLESGGCNPVPITTGVCTEKDEVFTVPASFLDENAYRFANWKKF